MNMSRKTERRTSNAERRGKRSALRGRAAEGAGERRSDVGGDDDLLGRLLRFHLFAAARSDPGRRIQHAAVLDDVLDLRAVESLELKQRFGDNVQFVTIGAENFFRGLISFVEEFAHFARSEEHTSELQSLAYLVCRLLLEKKKK